jgi:hypothetical protein
MGSKDVAGTRREAWDDRKTADQRHLIMYVSQPWRIARSQHRVQLQSLVAALTIAVHGCRSWIRVMLV